MADLDRGGSGSLRTLTPAVPRTTVTPLPRAVPGAPPAPARPRALPLSTPGTSPTISTGYSPDSKDNINEAKGAFKSDPFRRYYDQIAGEFQRLYEQRMPALADYDRQSQLALDQLIGTTTPQIQELFRQTGKNYGFAKDFYETGANYDTAARRTSEREKAMTDVRTASDASRRQAIDKLESFGIDPSQTRGASLDANLRLQTALSEVQAGTAAETGVEQRGREYTVQGLQALNQATGQQGQAINTAASTLQGNIGAVGQVAAERANLTTNQANLLEGRRTAIQTSEQAKRAQQQSILAQQAAKQKSNTAAGIGSILGTVAGGTLGYFASGGTGLGIAAGATAGGQVGTQAGGQV